MIPKGRLFKGKSLVGETGTMGIALILGNHLKESHEGQYLAKLIASTFYFYFSFNFNRILRIDLTTIAAVQKQEGFHLQYPCIDSLRF